MKKTLKSLVVKNTNNTCEVFDTVSLLDRFINFADMSNSSIYTYTKSIRQLFKFFADNGINTPTHDNIIEFKKYLVANNKSTHTISLYISAIKKFFSWCEAEGLYKNITVGIKAPRIDKGHKKDAFSGEQIREVMKGIDRNSLEGLRNYAILGLITTTGLRTIEVVRANIEDLRLNAGQPVLFVQGKGKSSKSDFVKLTPKVLQAVNAYLKARGNVKATEPLFASCSRRNSGQRLSTRTISGVCKKAMITAGFISTRLTAHSLRHTAITLALMAGQSLQEVQAFARHNSINTTLIYAHNVNRLNSHCERLIERQIF